MPNCYRACHQVCFNTCLDDKMQQLLPHFNSCPFHSFAACIWLVIRFVEVTLSVCCIARQLQCHAKKLHAVQCLKSKRVMLTSVSAHCWHMAQIALSCLAWITECRAIGISGWASTWTLHSDSAPTGPTGLWQKQFASVAY